MAGSITSRADLLKRLRALHSPYKKVGELRALHNEAADAIEQATPAPSEGRDDYVAWCRYENYNGVQPTSIHICDSDAPGAFKVYRGAPSATAHGDDRARLVYAIEHDGMMKAFRQTFGATTESIIEEIDKARALDSRRTE